jgi:transposase
MSKLLVFQDTSNYYLYRKPVKMSRSFDELAALIRTELDKDIISGDARLLVRRPATAE